MIRKRSRRRAPQVTPSGERAIGALVSAKRGEMVPFRSADERTLIRLLEADEAILTYEQEPRAIHYTYQGRRHTYRPAFLARHRDEGLLLISYASQKQRAAARWAADLSAAQRYCAGHELRLIVYTEDDLRRQTTLLDNVQLLAGYGRAPLPVLQRDYILAGLEELGGAAVVADLIRFRPKLPPVNIKAAVWHLLARGELRADLSRPLDIWTTEVRLTSTGGNA